MGYMSSKLLVDEGNDWDLNLIRRKTRYESDGELL